MTVVLVGCSCSRLDCGPGTHVEGNQCVPDEGGSHGPGGTTTGTGTHPGTGTGTTGVRDPVVWEVCGTGARFDKIQDAVDEARDGDVIEICAGSYEHAQIVSVDVEIRGEDKHTTVIDGGEFFPALGIVDATVTLSGLTLTGSPMPIYQRTAALDVTLGAVVRVHDLIVSGVRTEGPSRAIRASDSDLTLERVLIEDNQTVGTVMEVNRGSFTAVHNI